MFCSLDGKEKSYCTPEAYRGETCWLFRNRGNGTFEDVTATCGIFDSSSKSLGVALVDYDQDGWPDIFVANDTQPNKLYRNLRNGKFRDVALEMGVALSEDGKARAGMGVDAADFDGSGGPGLAITNFDNEMIGLYRPQSGGTYLDVANRSGVGVASLTRLGFGCVFADLDLDGALDLVVANGHIDETVRNIRGNVGYAQAPLLFLNQGDAMFRDVASLAGSAFAQARVGRGLAYGDFDRDGDVDLLMTTNNGPAVLFRNDQSGGNRSVRFRLIGTQSNRDAIGATVRIFHGGSSQSRVVHSGSSYLSQSELPVTFGVGKRDVIDRVTIAWPNGRAEEFTKVAAGKQYRLRRGQGDLGKLSIGPAVNSQLPTPNSNSQERPTPNSQFPTPNCQLPTPEVAWHCGCIDSWERQTGHLRNRSISVSVCSSLLASSSASCSFSTLAVRWPRHFRISC